MHRNPRAIAGKRPRRSRSYSHACACDQHALSSKVIHAPEIPYPALRWPAFALRSRPRLRLTAAIIGRDSRIAAGTLTIAPAARALYATSMEPRRHNPSDLTILYYQY